jgi:DNA repair exonuclease SbcCD ATPase subunit
VAVSTKSIDQKLK